MTAAGGNGKDDATEKILPEHTDAPDPAGVESEPSSLAALAPQHEEFDALRRQCDELKDALLRRRAEFENYRKRSERDQQAAARDAAAAVLRRFVGTVDNLERALSATGDQEALRQGVELTLRDLLAAFDAEGVTVIDPRGRRFDPAQHQALLHEPVPGFDAGMVAEVFRKGYAYQDRLLRPALVKVASGEGGQQARVDGAESTEVQ